MSSVTPMPTHVPTARPLPSQFTEHLLCCYMCVEAVLIYADPPTHPSPTHLYTCGAPLTTTHLFMGQQRVRHILMHTGMSGWHPPHPFIQSPTLTVPKQLSTVGPGFEHSPTLTLLFCTQPHRPPPLPEAPILQLGGCPQPLPSPTSPISIQESLEGSGAAEGEELTQKKEDAIFQS